MNLSITLPGLPGLSYLELNKQVADELDISMKTVQAHLARVMEKMGVRTLAELVKAVMSVN